MIIIKWIIGIVLAIFAFIILAFIVGIMSEIYTKYHLDNEKRRLNFTSKKCDSIMTLINNVTPLYVAETLHHNRKSSDDSKMSISTMYEIVHTLIIETIGETNHKYICNHYPGFDNVLSHMIIHEFRHNMTIYRTGINQIFNMMNDEDNDSEDNE